MGRTPDFFPGQRLEESIRFLSGTVLPNEPGVMSYVSGANAVSGSGLYLSEEGVPVGPFRKLINSESHARLRQLIHLADSSGPFEGFSGVVKDTDTSVFSTGSIWFTDLNRTKKIIDKTVLRTGIFPTSIRWNAYNADGSTIESIAVDNIIYAGVFEQTRVRWVGDAETVIVFPLGDSLTHGQVGLSGGWKSQMLSDVIFIGPYVDEVGISHGGRDGDYIQSPTEPDMYDRCAAQIADVNPQEVWITGGTNDAAGGSASASTLATRLSALITEILTVHTGVIRVFSPPPWNPSTSATTELERFWRRHIQPVVDTFRSSSNYVYFHHTGGQLTTSDLDGAISQHPVDGTYDVNGYGLWASLNDIVLSGGSQLNPSTLSLEAEYIPINYNESSGVWVDSSGNARDATAISTKPTLATGSTGQPVVRFAASALRTGTGWGVSQPNTVFLLVESVDNTSTQPAIIDGSDLSNRQLIQPTTSGQFRVWATTYATDTEMLMILPHLYAVEFSGSTTKVWCDGNPRYNDLIAGSNAMGGLTIGGSAATTPTFLFNGDIGYLAVYSGSLTDAEHFSIASYFRELYDFWPKVGNSTAW